MAVDRRPVGVDTGPVENELTAEKVCRNCGVKLRWHTIGQTWVHEGTSHCWCFPDRQGYDQPRATPAHIDGTVSDG